MSQSRDTTKQAKSPQTTRRVPARQAQAAEAQADLATRMGAVGYRTAERAQVMHQVQRQYGNRAANEWLDGASQAAGPEGGRVERRLANDIQRATGTGSRLPANERAANEQQLGASFKHVRLHTDAQANSLSGQLHAKAFTYGSDVFFSAGGYNRATLTHELSHVVQQTGPRGERPVSGGPIKVGPSNDSYERAADAAAHATAQQPKAQAAVQRADEDEPRRSMPRRILSGLGSMGRGMGRAARGLGLGAMAFPMAGAQALAGRRLVGGPNAGPFRSSLQGVTDSAQSNPGRTAVALGQAFNPMFHVRNMREGMNPGYLDDRRQRLAAKAEQKRRQNLSYELEL
jgi:hypothetical protein